ncbi:response regulator [Stagnimonas aquatica]|uniref:Response regulator n=1 Tax=Stagnimonas aquatica TaxID=2689987 RepID=A0A3N0V1P9_9GAMM|nr:response regulator [Stagnimonas aquatica]ROH86727.1 response regulator [Stagnimonas aquatica]
MNQSASVVTKPRVLFVDDEPRVLTSMRMQFRGQYEMYFAEGGHKALEFLKTATVDVIVSDQRMPGITGIEVLRAARELNPHAMRILLTGYSDLNAIIDSVNEGEIFRFVSKPWDNDVLASTVANAAAAAKLSQQAAAVPEPITPEPERDAPGVLVLDDDPRMAAKIQVILGDQFKVYGAASMDEAVQRLEQASIGVVISDTRVQNQPVVSLIGSLKQHQPQLVSVILTERADAGAAIELINQGQIYRLITKPIQDIACRITVNSAHKQHQKLALNPVLQRRYEVEAPAPTAAAPPPALKLLDRIRSLRSWASGRS